MTRTKSAAALFALACFVCLVPYFFARALDAQQTTFLQPTPTTATWTAATAQGTVVSISTATLSTVIVTLNGTDPLTDGRIEFVAADDPATVAAANIVWYPVTAFRMDTGDRERSFPILATRQAWRVPTEAFRRLGVRLVVPISGSGSAQIRLSSTAAPGGSMLPAEMPGVSALLSPNRTTSQTAPAYIGLIGSLGQKVGSHGTGIDAYVINAYDPCETPLKSNLSISQITSTQILQTNANKRFYMCSLFLVAADAEQISLVEGIGSICAVAVALVGGTTAGTGVNLGANGGFMLGNGQGTVAMQNFAQANICLLQSGTGRVAGNMTYDWN